jgi:hypothetical protein
MPINRPFCKPCRDSGDREYDLRENFIYNGVIESKTKADRHWLECKICGHKWKATIEMPYVNLYKEANDG